MGIVVQEVQSKSSSSEEEKVAEKQLQLVSTPVVVSTSKPITKEEAYCLKELKKLIKEDELVREYSVAHEEEFLLGFVRGKCCKPDKAFKVLKNHVHVVRIKYVKFFQTLSPRKFGYLIDGSLEGPRLCGLLRHVDLKGRKVGVANCSVFDHRIHKGDDVIPGIVTAGLELLRTEEAPRNGIVLVIDGSGFGLRHAREFSMSRIYMFLTIFLNAYPLKYEGFHILNNTYLFDTILVLVKQLIPKKLRERIHLHGSNYSSLYEHVPQEILPETFGGLLSEEDAFDVEMEQRILARTEYYEKLGQNL